MAQGLIVRDLGELTGDVLVFGGPYSNLQATEALIAQARGRGITPGNCICTGDVVAYCADPVKTIALIRDFGCPLVAGNCEKQLAANALDCGCGFEEGTICDALSAEWYRFANSRVATKDRVWMGNLPDILQFRHHGKSCAVIHGGATDVSRFIWPSSAAKVFVEEISLINWLIGKVDVVFAGHSGMAFARDVQDVSWINPGVIGMPGHDGRAQTRFALFSGRGVVFHRLTYDAEAASQAMVQCGLVQGYEKTLKSGLWPSEDVLPEALRR